MRYVFDNAPHPGGMRTISEKNEIYRFELKIGVEFPENQTMNNFEIVCGHRYISRRNICEKLKFVD